MQRTHRVASLLVCFPLVISAPAAIAAPASSARGFPAQASQLFSKGPPSTALYRHGRSGKAVPYVKSHSSFHGDRKLPKPLLPPIHERKRELPLILGAGSAPFFLPADHPDFRRAQVQQERALAPEFFPDEVIARPFIEAPRPYAPPAFTIIGKPSRKGMGGSVQLVRGGALDTSASDPRVIFLNDDGSESRPVNKNSRRK